MLNRYQPWLRLLCFVLAAIVLYQLARLARPRGQALAAFRPERVEFQADAVPAPTNALPSDILARVERIKGSQILGQVMVRPPAMPALLGVAGADVLLRAPNGQTGLAREGEEFGGVRVLRVGLNRVLVQYDGKTNELTIFDGFGSESLLGNKK